MLRFPLVTIWLLLGSTISLSYTLQCMDENNNPVDWYIVYKLPKITTADDELQRSGVAYAYLTSDDYDSWTFSKLGIDSTESMVANTLSELYESSENLGYILYNDEPPSRKGKSSKGHTKGVVAAKKNGGFWLIHSVPKFADIDSGEYIYPNTGKVYGQTFLCISLNLTNLDTVGLQLQFNQPDIYSSNIPDGLNSYLPEWSKAVDEETESQAPWSHLANLVSKSGTSFIGFAKSKGFGKELYEDLVAPTLKVDLLVESWRKGTGLLESDCSNKYKVNNLLSVKIGAPGVTFLTTKDHSKWAVSVIDEKPWICIGDINRAEAQKRRGGGTVCFNKQPVVKLFRESVASIEPCNDYWSKIVQRKYAGLENKITGKGV